MSESAASANIKGDLINLFRQSNGILENNSGALLNEHREQAFQDFDRLGIPTAKNEEYKYTPLEKSFSGNYEVDFKANPFKIDIRNIFTCEVPELDAHVILVVNGFYSPGHKSGILPPGVIICGLNEASVKYPDLFRKHYARYAITSSDPLVALNTLFAQDGVFIYVPKNTVIEKPLQIISLGYSDRNLRITRRNLIVVEENAVVNFVMCDHTLSNQSFLANTLTEIYAGSNSVVTCDRLQNENSLSTHISNMYIRQDQNSRFTSSVLTLHSGLALNHFYALLNGENCETRLNGLFLCQEKEHVANHILIDHASPRCTSNQLFQGNPR